MSNTVILYGPKATGKTRWSGEIAEHYGCSGISDEWDRKKPMEPGHLHITTRDYSNANMVMHDSETQQVSDVTCVSIREALTAIGAKAPCNDTPSAKLQTPPRRADEEIAKRIRQQAEDLQASINEAAQMGIKCEIAVLEHTRIEVPHEVPSLLVSVSKVL